MPVPQGIGAKGAPSSLDPSLHCVGTLPGVPVVMGAVLALPFSAESPGDVASSRGACPGSPCVCPSGHAPSRAGEQPGVLSGVQAGKKIEVDYVTPTATAGLNGGVGSRGGKCVLCTCPRVVS